MTRKPKILAVAGSLREKSFNKRVLQTALKGAEKAGAEITFADLREFPMPLFNSDDEAANGLDENAIRFQNLLAEHDGFLIASPEYNGSLTAALKNAIDWASRPGGRYERSDIFTGKFAAILTASPGSFGGVRVLSHLRAVLTSIGVYVLPTEIAVPFVSEKFSGANEEEMTDERTRGILENLGAALVEAVRKTRLENELALGTNN
jgi:NAD(P)H-dependent FMN reductase